MKALTGNRLADGEAVFLGHSGDWVPRFADAELFECLKRGEFCYVLSSRQMGKSSLMVATRERLAAASIRSVEIDLTKMGSQKPLTHTVS